MIKPKRVLYGATTTTTKSFCRYVDNLEKYVKYLEKQVKTCNLHHVIGELTCDSCGCHPNVIYTTNKGRFCEKCKPAS